mmetsp:Transcript_25851/g.34412  ORF Transcript_25851/g.34412 Transcript_25851/m.34412 type:complete len:405 (+) Transcript_25851:105-1319(+)
MNLLPLASSSSSTSLIYGLVLWCYLILTVKAFAVIPHNQKNAALKNNNQPCNTPPLKMSDSAAADLLYKEQEDLIVKRGRLEEELMSNTGAPLLASKVKVRGAGKAGGFGGGGGAGKSKAAALKTEAKSHAKVLKKDGVVRIDNVLPGDVADQLRTYLYDLRKKAESDVESGKVKPIQRFANVLLRKDRCDLTVPLGEDEITTVALQKVLLESAVGGTIKSILGKGSILYELSCLMSDPGSQRQVVHPDTPYLEGKDAVLYTCFIALQDVRMDMGPTAWLPGTHTAKAHELFQDTNTWSEREESSKDELIRTHPSVLGILPRGSCAIFDSRCLHCGTANKSEDYRALFYFSFKNPKVGYPGNPASIRTEIGAAQLTMEQLEGDLESYEKGKGSPLFDEIASKLK